MLPKRIVPFFDDDDLFWMFGDAATPPFPTQYEWMRMGHGGVMERLSVVLASEYDGPLRITKAGTTYVLYDVDTADTNASPLRFFHGGGVRAVRRWTP